jgi:hypothetical protein
LKRWGSANCYDKSLLIPIFSITRINRVFTASQFDNLTVLPKAQKT